MILVRMKGPCITCPPSRDAAIAHIWSRAPRPRGWRVKCGGCAFGRRDGRKRVRRRHRCGHGPALVGHYTRGGEVSRYIGRHGTTRVAKVVLVVAVLPIMLKSAANPEGLPMEVFDNLRSGLFKDCSRPTWRRLTSAGPT